MLSDHKIVEMKLKMKTPRHSNEKGQKKRRNIISETMMNREIAELYRKRTEERASQEAARRGVKMEDLEWETLGKTLRATAEEVCGKREKKQAHHRHLSLLIFIHDTPSVKNLIQR